MKKELWLRLKGYHFDHLVPPHLTDHVAAAFGGADASTKAFASKLGRKLGWPTPFAIRAIDEYKKFVYLGIVSDFSVTPPKLIDQVWHEHLLFSRAYRDFCRDVIGREFDHNPELVPTDPQTDTFQTQYVATLDLYQTEFNTLAPADIWGTPKFKRPVGSAADEPKPRQRARDDSYGGDPLYMYFDSSGSDHAHAHHAMPEFGGGGGFAGAGSEGSWDGHSHGDGSGHGDGGSSDSGSGDGGGGGDGGGSGCSSSCGGGGCGGS